MNQHKEVSVFPEVNLADESGLLCISDHFDIELIRQAYKKGIFPWYESEGAIFWYAPDPRCILFPKDIKVSKSMKQFIRKDEYEVTINKAFWQVINLCALAPRSGQDGTWVSNRFIQNWCLLHNMKRALSVEVWNKKENKLVGGLYGTDLGTVFCGESMFSLESNTSKLALIALCRYLENKNYTFIDCQVMNHFTQSMGAIDIDRRDFMKRLDQVNIQF